MHPSEMYRAATSRATEVANATLDPAVVDACIAMFLPAMPKAGRAAGIIGPAVDIGDGAPPQDRLLAALGRQP